MRITIHRGTNQIGGCVTEYEHNGWRLFVDYGEQLPGAPVSEQQLEIDGLTYGDISKSALLITHYHGDHIGKVVELPANLPIFMGETAKEIQTGYSKHLKSVSKEHRQMTERLTSVSTFSPGEPFSFGDFQVMPIVIDHSAFDAYAFRIEADKIKVFHTGDFRTHGFRSKICQKSLTYLSERWITLFVKLPISIGPIPLRCPNASFNGSSKMTFRQINTMSFTPPPPI